MNFSAILSVLSLIGISSVFAATSEANSKTVKSLTKESICSRKLAEVLYYPQLPVFKYLEALGNEFLPSAGTALLQYQIDPSKGGLLYDFLQKYQVNMYIIFPFGDSIYIKIVDGVPKTQVKTGKIFPHVSAQAVLTTTAYGFDAELQMYGAQFNAINADTATYVAFIIELPAQNYTPNICAN